MKPKKIILITVVLASVIFSQCKSCDCGYQPKKASVKRPWVKK